MNKKRIILLISALLLLTFSLLLSSCGKNKSYTVSLDPNGGALASPTVEVKFSESYLLPTPTLPGYTFTGWYHDETKVETYGVWSIENDIDLVAQWELTNFQITTTLNGGTLDIDLPSTYTMNSEDIQLAAPVKENHIFLYWKDQNNNTYDGDFVIESGSTQHFKLTAVWWDFFDENKVKYSYDGEGLTVVGYEGTVGAPLNIPNEYLGVPVVAIADNAFKDTAYRLKSDSFFRIRIPDTVTSIGQNAFLNCKGVKLVLTTYDDMGMYRELSTESDIEYINEWVDALNISNVGNDGVIDVICVLRPAIGYALFVQP